MHDQIVLTLPDDISARVRQIAQLTDQSVEKVLLNHLRTLPIPLVPSDLQSELAALPLLSDEALWALAHELLPEDVQYRAHRLMDKHAYGELTDEENCELEQLVQRSDRLMLRKTEAYAILRTRKHSTPCAQVGLELYEEALDTVKT